jgi:hypothetical protein
VLLSPNSNRGTENNNQNNFDANGNLLHLDNIANLEWYILKAFLVLNVGEYYCQYSLIL